MSNCLSNLPSSVSNSRLYESPEQPPPFTPIRRKAFSRPCPSKSSFTRLAAVGVRLTAIAPPLLSPPLSCPRRCRLLLRPLLLEVLDGRLDRVLGQDGAVDLDRRQLQLGHDVRILDLERGVDALPLQPLGRQAGTRNRGAAAEGLELRVLDDPRVEVDLDLELHDVTALGRADEPRPDAGLVLGERAHVPGVVVVVDDLLAVRHKG